MPRILGKTYPSAQWRMLRESRKTTGMTDSIPEWRPTWLASALIGLTLMVSVVLGFASALANGPKDATQTVVMFSPAVSAERALSLVVATGAKPIDQGLWAGVLLVDASEEQQAALKHKGAWLVTNSAVLAGCVTTLSSFSKA